VSRVSRKRFEVHDESLPYMYQSMDIVMRGETRAGVDREIVVGCAESLTVRGSYVGGWTNVTSVGRWKKEHRSVNFHNDRKFVQ